MSPRSRSGPRGAPRRLVLGSLGLAASGLATLALAVPPNPTRPTAPPGIERRALAVGARAPQLSLPSTAGERWDLGAALAKGRVVLLFYRGDW